MLWLPTTRLLVLQVAVLLLPMPASGAALQPLIAVPPSVKLTLPVGAAPLTVAVNVTLVPTTAGLAELASVVVVAAGAGLLITCASTALLEAALLVSPL